MFSQTTEYAVRAMAWLALTPNELVPTVSLAEHTQVPSHYLAKVLQQLAAAELITGRRGVGGGYRLSRPAGEISVMSVVRAVSSLERITTCPLGIASHGPNLCPLHRLMDQAAKVVIEVLEGRSLADLINQPGMNTPLCNTAPGTTVPLSLNRT
ncbi:MAG: Rrf2 family transcriptional regulator [Phycisphaerales bacterium]